MRTWACALFGLASIVALVARGQTAESEKACVAAPPIADIDIGDRRDALQATAGRKAVKANIHALAIGISQYGDRRLDLSYPAADAAGLAEVLRGQDGKLFGQVEVTVLTDDGATGTAIRRALKRLADRVRPEDLALIFLAGDGTTDAQGRLWFLPYDADPNAIAATALSRDQIADILLDLPNAAILFLDACHGPEWVLNAGARCTRSVGAAAKDFASAGIVTYSACAGHEPSVERESWGHGAFAKALIEGLGGTAAIGADKTITTATLDAFLARRVEELTGGAQHPVMTRPAGLPDFPIAISP